MSIAELHACIDQLSADIIWQKEVLKHLESRKSTAQRQLNVILDPVARLPHEISSEIFVQCLPARPGPQASDAPLVFLNICNTWTDIALSTPALWAAIHLDGRPVSDQSSLLDAWLERAGSRPISISLPTNLPADMAAVIARHADNLQDLRMIQEDDVTALITSAGPFVCLTTLAMSGFPEEGTSPSRTTRSTMELLRASPNLVECTFDRMFYEDDHDHHATAEVLVLPDMEHLKFAKYPGSFSSERILDYISTPRLQTLHFPSYSLAFEGLSRFLKRSSPPLQKLVLGCRVPGRWCGWTAKEMEKCLSLLPELTHLEVYQPWNATADNIFTILADSPRIVPKLSSFTLRRFHPTTLCFQKLLAGLSVRHKQINSVRLQFHSDSEPPAEEVCVALRRFVADGISIQIGTEERNYI
ncbi:hypothetical protein DFH09DRAFT_175897 [Mycena vulgaris]|nr:hypothetical protein DFH09DRAFT_175897 [Mycena vulgaris]